MKRYEVQVLRRAGHSYPEIESLTGVPERSARRIVAEPPAESISANSGKSRGIGRPSKAERFRGDVEGWFEEDPELPTRELLRRAKERGYRGGKSAFYELVRKVRPPRSSFVSRFEGACGRVHPARLRRGLGDVHRRDA